MFLISGFVSRVWCFVFFVSGFVFQVSGFGVSPKGQREKWRKAMSGATLGEAGDPPTSHAKIDATCTNRHTLREGGREGEREGRREREKAMSPRPNPGTPKRRFGHTV